jgi:aerobic carbon-monoxide dehydrogenase large subunit
MEAATQTNGGDRFVGRPMKRREDPRFITGTGAFVDDLHIPGTVHAAIVRSTEAHAAITSIDTSEAAAQPGVLGAFTADDLSFESGIPMVWAPPGVDVNTPDHLPLKSGEVKCVGDPVAVVVGSDRR